MSKAIRNVLLFVIVTLIFSLIEVGCPSASTSGGGGTSPGGETEGGGSCEQGMPEIDGDLGVENGEIPDPEATVRLQVFRGAETLIDCTWLHMGEHVGEGYYFTIPCRLSAFGLNPTACLGCLNTCKKGDKFLLTTTGGLTICRVWYQLYDNNGDCMPCTEPGKPFDVELSSPQWGDLGQTEVSFDFYIPQYCGDPTSACQ